MDTIQVARELGRAIQQDNRYVRVLEAQQRNDNDAQLQIKISQFNNLRGTLNAEITKEDKDTDRIKEIDTELKALYQDIFSSEGMQEFSTARNELQTMLTFVNQIISGSANGEDPDLIEYQESCGGDCGGCSGCS